MKNTIMISTGILINAPVSKVWEALTTPSIIRQYFFGTNTVTDWKEGRPIVFKGEWQGKTYEDKGTILDFQPNKLLRYSYWSSLSGKEDKAENYANVSYQLSEKENGTEILITQDNIADEKTKEHSLQNWNKVLVDLKELVEKKLV